MLAARTLAVVCAQAAKAAATDAPRVAHTAGSGECVFAAAAGGVRVCSRRTGDGNRVSFVIGKC